MQWDWAACIRLLEAGHDMKRMFNILLWCLATLTLCFQAAQAQGPGSWKIGHVRSAGSVVDQDVARFIEDVTAATDGAIDFTVYPGNRLGDYSVVQERVSFGEVQMYVGPFGTAVDKKLALSFTPFLVKDWQEAKRVYSSSSPLRRHMDGYLKAQNIKILAGYPVYFGGVGLTEKPKAPADPNIAKNMIIRVPPMRCFELTARELGYTPYPITWMYAKMGLKTGMVSGMIGGGAEGYAGLPALRYYLPIKDHFEYWYIYVNLDAWQSLSAAHQQVLGRATAAMEQRRWAVAEELEMQSITALDRAGLEILAISPETYSTMQKKIKDTVYPVLEKDIGPAFSEVVRYAEKR